jgi:signal transduction histidine kinase
MIGLPLQSALVAIIVSIATTVALLLRSRQSLYVRFAAFAIGVASYYLTALLSAISDHALLASARIVAGGGVVIVTTVFFDALLGEAGVLARQRRRKTYLAGLAMIAVGLTPLASQFWAQATAGTVALVLLGARVQAVLNRAAEVESAADKARLKYLAYGGYAALLGFVFDLLQGAGWPLPAIGGLLVAIYLYFISQVLLVSRLLDLHELLGRAMVFGTLALVLALLYGLLVISVGARPGLFLFNTLVASSLILILFEPIKTYLEELTARIFFRERVTFARDLRKAVRRLATLVELPAAIDFVLQTIYDHKRATHTSVYLLDRDGLGFVLQGHRGARPIPRLDGAREPALFRHILEGQSPVLKDAVYRRLTQSKARRLLLEGEDKDSIPPYAEDEALMQGLDELNADLLVPLRSTDGVMGLLCLRDERLTEAYSSEEIAALIQIADQLSITVSNSRVIGQLKERDRLAALGEMSAGLAHEIRNPLAAIKGAAQVLDPERIGGDDGELLQVIVNEVNRLNTVVVEFLDYARPFRGTFAAVSVNEAVRRTVGLLEHDLPPEVKIHLDLSETMPDISGDAEQLHQVLINLILNAADAMDRKGDLDVATRRVENVDLGWRAAFRGAHQVEIRVSDSGPGISENLKDKIFIPFFTTKSRGTGLGLALCQRIIQHHGGSIEVRSGEGRGATFVIRLPAIGRPAPEKEESEEETSDNADESNEPAPSPLPGPSADRPEKDPDAQDSGGEEGIMVATVAKTEPSA